MKRWRNERATAVQWVRQRADEAGSASALAREIGISSTYLRAWLRDEWRGMSPPYLERIRLSTGLPTAALVHKNEPICRVVRREGAGC